jgi:hypothetical protein
MALISDASSLKTQLLVSTVVALAIAAALGFVAGYAFHATAGTELSAARQAVLEAQGAQRVLQSFELVLHNSGVHAELSAVQSPEDLKRLTAKYREATLRSIEHFEQGAGQLDLPKDRALATPFLQEARKLKSAIPATP